jgi:hypothetical protein
VSLTRQYDYSGSIRWRRYSEWVTLPVNDKYVDARLAQLCDPALLRTARRMQRERQRNDAVGARCTSGPASHPRAVTATALHERQARKLGAQRSDDVQPGGVLRPWCAWCPSAADPVRLQDASYHAAEAQRSVPDGQQVLGIHSAAGPMGHQDQERGRFRPVDRCLRGAGPGADLHAGRVTLACAAATTLPAAPGKRLALRQPGDVHRFEWA